MTGIGGIGAGGGTGATLTVGGATAIMAAMPAPMAAVEGGAPAGRPAATVSAGADSPMMKFAEKLDDLMTTALLLELMDNKKDESSSGIADALVAAAAVSLYKEMQSLDSAGASTSVAGVTISITA